METLLISTLSVASDEADAGAAAAGSVPAMVMVSVPPFDVSVTGAHWLGEPEVQVLIPVPSPVKLHAPASGPARCRSPLTVSAPAVSACGAATASVPATVASPVAATVSTGVNALPALTPTTAPFGPPAVSDAAVTLAPMALTCPATAASPEGASASIGLVGSRPRSSVGPSTPTSTAAPPAT